MALTPEQVEAKLRSFRTARGRVGYLYAVLARKRLLSPATIESINQLLQRIHPRAVQEALKARQYDEAAELFAKAGLHKEGAEAWLKAGRPGAAAELFAKAGLHKEGAEAWLKAGYPKLAARLFAEGGLHKKAGEAYERAGMPVKARLAYQRAEAERKRE